MQSGAPHASCKGLAVHARGVALAYAGLRGCLQAAAGRLLQRVADCAAQAPLLQRIWLQRSTALTHAPQGGLSLA